MNLTMKRKILITLSYFFVVAVVTVIMMDANDDNDDYDGNEDAAIDYRNHLRRRRLCRHRR